MVEPKKQSATRAAKSRGRSTRRPRSASVPGPFPIVGVGASAGGLDALGRLLGHLPPDTGMAFVVVQHLDPKHESRLTEILSRATSMPVAEVRDGMPVERDHVYILPPRMDVSLRGRVLRLAPRRGPRAPHLPVDLLFRSLARAEGQRAVGVVLSGTASDGAAGIKAIKAAGGITFAQDGNSAKFFGMPHSSILTGAVDFVLPPEEIAERLALIGRDPDLPLDEAEGPAPVSTRDASARAALFGLLKKSFGVDFNLYKSSTVARRIRRRMALQGIRDVGDYLRRVRGHPDELAELYRDMFIGVTSFFREPGTFDALKKLVFPRILERGSKEASVRIWVPGCSTGEEAYSIAIALVEHLKNRAGGTPIRIFGTDVNEEAVRTARQGEYAKSIAADVGRSRLRRFFLETEHGFQISKAVRDLCVFAKHDISRDPPYSHLDLICCRNVLIYLAAPLQQKLFPLFHYALKPTGFLLLGTAETVGGFSNLFAQADRKHRIYARRGAAARPRFEFSPESFAIPSRSPAGEAPRTPPDLDAQRDAADLIILNQYAPPAVLVGEDLEILHFRGHTGAYLESAPGVPSLNLLKMAREGLLTGLQSAVRTARRRNLPARVEGLRIEVEGRQRVVNVQVVPVRIPSFRQRAFLVLFEYLLHEQPEARPAGGRVRPDLRVRDEVAQVKQELAATKAYLQAVIEKQEAANEELRSLNEELLSTNEELQSTTEEMETANEELQSTNEELTTVNEELQHRIAEVTQAHNDISNLLGSIDLSLIIVDRAGRIRRWSPIAQTKLGLQPADAGRPLTDVRLGAEIPDLESLILAVTQGGGPCEREVLYRDRRWHFLQVRPYVTSDGRVDGAMIALTDVHERKLAADRLRAFLESAPDAMVIVDAGGIIVQVNAQTERLFGHSREELLGRHVEMLVPQSPRERQGAQEGDEAKASETWSTGTGLELTAIRRDGSEFPVEISSSPIETGAGIVFSSLIRDITERRKVEGQARRAAVLEERNRLAREIHDSLAQGLTGIVVQLEGAEDVLTSDPEAAGHHLREARDLARSSLEEARRSLLALRPGAMDDLDLPRALERAARRTAANASAAVEFSVSGVPVDLDPQFEEQVLRIAQEALANAVRHAQAKRIQVTLTYARDTLRLLVEDDGQGFVAGTSGGGGGLGLSIVEERAETIGAQLTVDSQPGKGTRVEVVVATPPTGAAPGPR